MKWPVVKLEDIATDMQPGFAMQPAKRMWAFHICVPTMCPKMAI